MTPQALAELLDVLSRAGVLTVAILVILGFLTGRIISKGQHEETKAELERERTAHMDELKRIDESIRRLDSSVDALRDRVRGP